MIPNYLTQQHDLKDSSYYFSYYNANNERVFYSRMFSGQCSFFKKNGERCKRRCVIPFEYCASHIQPAFNVSIRPSTIPEAGKGLFADNGTDDNSIVFKKNDVILQYFGEFLTRQELNDRYRDGTAPYAISLNNNKFVDSALLRSTSSIANTKRNNNNSSFSISNSTNSIKIKATKNIRNKQEIFVSYGNQYNFPNEDPKYDYKVRNYPAKT